MITRKKKSNQGEAWQGVADAIKTSSKSTERTAKRRKDSGESPGQRISLAGVDELHLVIAGSDGREVAEVQYLRKEDHQLMFIFRNIEGDVKEMFTRFDVDV